MRRWISFRPQPMLLGAMAVLTVSWAMACGAAAPAAPAQEPAAVMLAADEGDFTPILATKELGVGDQRIAFLLTSPKALITVPEVKVTSNYLGEGSVEGETKTAPYHVWPYGVRGTYVTDMTFGKPGKWRLDIEFDQEGEPGKTSLLLDVAKDGLVPQIGTVPPLSENKTLQTAGSIEKVTTDYSPDPDLYQLTVAEAVETGLPTVVVFASPAFCTSPTCGPQTDTVSELKDGYQGRANFIHVEIYDNPDEIQGDLNRAAIAQPLYDWGISRIPGWFNESWVFVLHPNGRIAQRFEGYATLDELKSALEPVLLPG